MVRSRLRILIAIFGLFFLAILARLAILQLDPETHRKYFRLSEHRTSVFSAPLRGRILSREGEVLAGNRPLYRLTFNYPLLNPRAEPLSIIVDELRKRFPFPDLETAERRLIELSNPRALAAGSAAGASAIPEWLRFVEKLDPRTAETLRRRLRLHRALFQLHPSATPGQMEIWFRPRRVVSMEVTLHRLAPLLAGSGGASAAYDRLRDRIDDEIQRVRGLVEADVKHDREEKARDEFIREKMRTSWRIQLASSWILASDVPAEAVTEVEYYPERFPGIQVEDGIRRIYPLGEAAGTLMGHLGKLNEKEAGYRKAGLLIEALHGIDTSEEFEPVREGCLRRTDRIGTSGIEEFREGELRGLYGMRVVSIDKLHRPKELIEDLPPVHGTDIRTTLDSSLQVIAYEALRGAVKPAGGPLAGTAGSAAVMSLADGETGAILASAGFPGVDSNRLTEDPGGYMEELESRWGGQTAAWLFDRPSRYPLHPGSVFKIVVAAGAIESGKELDGGAYTPEVEYPCRGPFDLVKGIRCASAGHGSLDLPAALQYSCNSYFYYLGLKRLGPEMLQYWALSFGFGRSPDIDLPRSRGERGRLFWSDRTRSSRGICEYVIGQSHIEATPIQVLRAFAAVALGGSILPRPYLVEPTAPHDPLPIRSPRGLEAVREGLWRAGHRPDGTAGKPELGLDRYDAAYKTGTAEVDTESGTTHHAWLAGFAPFHAPRIAFVIVIEKTPLHGAEACAPVARSILDHFASREPEAYLLEPGRAGSPPAMLEQMERVERDAGIPGG